MAGVRMTREEYRAYLEKQKPAKEKRGNKYGAKAKQVDGFLFQSTKEANRYLILKAWQQSGQITELEPHRRFPITVNGIYIGDYESDFTYKKNGVLVVEDTKSKPTRKLQLYQWKRKLMRAAHGIEVIEL